MKFLNLAITSILLGTTTFALADEKKSKDKKNQKNQAPSLSLGDKLPPYLNPNRFIVDGAFIYWQAKQDGLEYGLVENSQELFEPVIPTITTRSTADYSLSGNIKDQKMDFKWDPGFKFGVGVVFGERDQWDLFLNWTWLHSKANGSFKGAQVIDREFNLISDANSSSSLPHNYIIPSWSAVALGGPAANAKSNSKLKYNTIDLELGRNFFLSKNITLRPHIGLRGAFIHQNVKANYASILNVLSAFINGSPLTSSEFQAFSVNNRFKAKNNFDAVGLRGGLDANWNFTDCFAVYGKMSGAIMYGRFKVNENFNSTNALNTSFVSVGPITSVDLKENYDLTLNDNLHRIRSTLQAALGVTWHRGFNNDKQHLYVSLGYEFNEWFQQNELRELLLPETPNLVFFVDPADPSAAELTNFVVDSLVSSLKNNSTALKRDGDLGLQGLTFDVRFDF